MNEDPEIILQFEKVSKVYDGTRPVAALDDVSLVIRRGERVALMGPSGSGKSTFLNLISGLDEPTSGRILLSGIDLGSLNDDDLTRLRRNKTGMIFQTFNLLPTLTALENVALPLRLQGADRRSAETKALAMIDRVGLRDRAGHDPDELSGGERQRIAIARALVLDPPLLLADEPTGNLDSRTGEDVLLLLDRLHAEMNTTLILVTHDEQAAEFCERRITLRDGRITGDQMSSAVG